jgi:hypothetical protein
MITVEEQTTPESRDEALLRYEYKRFLRRERKAFKAALQAPALLDRLER